MLFPRADLDTFAFAHSLGEGEVARGFDTLARLQHLHRSGYWSTLRETNVEQSFVERVLGQVFGYATLLSQGSQGSVTELLPELYVPIPGTAGKYPDFGLGFFHADRRHTVVTGELKGPGADLDAKQGGGYGGLSPVEQAMAAAVAAHAEWCLVSNTTEVRLYRVPDLASFEQVSLLDVVAPRGFRRAHALLSRRSLLGTSEVTSSPLSRFYAHHTAGESMLVPARNDRVRLIQRARPLIPQPKHGDVEQPFARLSQWLEAATESVPDAVAGGGFERPRLEGDQLVVDRTTRGEPTPWQRIAIAKSGLLVMSYSIPLGQQAGGPDQPIYVEPTEVLRLLVDMIAFGWSFFYAGTRAAKHEFVVEWSLEDLSTRVRAGRWVKPTLHTPLTCQANVERTAYPEFLVRYVGSGVRNEIGERLGETIRELFFPFDGTDEDARRCRVEPTLAEITEVLNKCRSLAVIPA